MKTVYVIQMDFGRIYHSSRPIRVFADKESAENFINKIKSQEDKASKHMDEWHNNNPMPESAYERSSNPSLEEVIERGKIYDVYSEACEQYQIKLFNETYSEYLNEEDLREGWVPKFSIHEVKFG